MHKFVFIILIATIAAVTGQECHNAPYEKTWKDCTGGKTWTTCNCTACPNKKEELLCKDASETGNVWKTDTKICVDCLKSRCWSSYKPSTNMKCTNPEVEMELPVGAKFNCTCNNCAPVTITCESKGSAKEWAYDGICENNTYANVRIPKIDPNALLSKNSSGYTFSCITGYEVTGSKHAECNSGIVSTSPYCERVKCIGNSPSEMDCPGMDTNTEAVFEDMRQCNCKHTCMPINITCDSTRQWNYMRTPCLTNDSFSPTALIEFGEHILTSFENEKLKFQCKKGYELNGNSTVECINGTRNSEIPKCEEVVSSGSNIVTISICMLILGILIISIIFFYRKHTTKLSISTANGDSMRTEENYEHSRPPPQEKPGMNSFSTMNRGEENYQHTRPLPPLEKQSSVEYDEIVVPNSSQRPKIHPTSPTLSSEYAVPHGTNMSSEYAVVVLKDQAKDNASPPIYSQVVLLNGKKQTQSRGDNP